MLEILKWFGEDFTRFGCLLLLVYAVGCVVEDVVKAWKNKGD